MRKILNLSTLIVLLTFYDLYAQANHEVPPGDRSPLVSGETFTIDSEQLGELRRINVYKPVVYGESDDQRLPVLYMLDGGIREDFLHIAGLVQISSLNGTMRPYLLVGIENTDHRRDLTGPTEIETDKSINPSVGGSSAFRSFIRDELMPAIRATYLTTDETAIVGESLAGLFVVESFILEPEMFDTYIAVDPSLWWNNHQLTDEAVVRLRQHVPQKKTLYLATSRQSGIREITERLANALQEEAFEGIVTHYSHYPDETHGTVFHPAALEAFRTVFAPYTSSE